MAAFGALAGGGAEVVAAGGAVADVAAAEGAREEERLHERGDEKEKGYEAKWNDPLDVHAGECGTGGADAGDAGEGGFGGLGGHPGVAGHVAKDDAISLNGVVVSQPDLFAANSLMLPGRSCVGLGEGNRAEPIEFILMGGALFAKLE